MGLEMSGIDLNNVSFSDLGSQAAEYTIKNARTALILLAEIPELGTLHSKQIAAMAGLAPFNRDSGEWKGKRFIGSGRKHLRHALYLPALVASRFNADLKAKHTQLIDAGKPAKVGLTAIMRKLIILANALVKADRKWQDKMA